MRDPCGRMYFTYAPGQIQELGTIYILIFDRGWKSNGAVSMAGEMAYRIIVIDDDPDIAEEVCETLEQAKLSCAHASSAEEACALLAGSDRSGPVIVDYHMPGINGIEMIELLRVRARRPLAFIMLTGDETQAVAAGAVRAHAFDFLSKPFKREELLSAVHRAAEHLDELSKAEADQKELEGEAEALRQRVDVVSEMLQQREKLLAGVFKHPVPAVERLTRSHACATIDFLDRIAQIEDTKARQSRQGSPENTPETAGQKLDALDCAPIEMAGLLKRMMPAVKKLADEQEVTIKSVIPGHLPYLYGDEPRLMRGMQDLLVTFVRELGAGDRLNVILMKQDEQLILTLRLHSQRLTAAFFDVFRGELSGVIDRLNDLPAPQAKLLASRIVIDLHAGRIVLEQAGAAEWCLRVALPVPAESSRKSLAVA